MRQALPKPWEAIGMSRASWYRHGKPTEKPRKPNTAADEARLGRVSVRTYHRIMRVIKADVDLAVLMGDGWCKPGQAERIVADPVEHRRFRKWLRAEKRRLG
jgi:hypothetical protein